MKKNETAFHFSIDGRWIVILLVLLLLLAAGAWSTRASPLDQDTEQAAGLDANAEQSQVVEETQELQLPDYDDPNAGPEEIQAEPQDFELPDNLDANGAAATEPEPQGDLGEIQVLDALSSDANSKLYYLTNFSRIPSQALTACTATYHMAALWELYDLSNLRYNSSHPQAYKKTDSGSGPPSHWYGWIRTGYDSNATTNTAGIANCANWTSSTAGHFGTIMRLNYNWDVSSGGVGAWEADTWTCAGTAPIWCIED